MSPLERGRIQRRDVLRVAAGGAVGAVALSGTARAHAVGCIYFCGCGRLVAYREAPKEDDGGGSEGGNGLPQWYPVLVAREGGGPGRPELRHYLVEGENRNVEFTNRGRGKILAFGVEDTVYYNPNQCAQNVFDAYGEGDTEAARVRSTLEDYFGSNDARSDAENPDAPDDDEYVAFSRVDEVESGQKGHCHPPRDDYHCDHGNGSSSGRGNSKGRSR